MTPELQESLNWFEGLTTESKIAPKSDRYGCNLAVAVREMESELSALKAKMPRVWDNDTIKDAPEGEYRLWYSGSEDAIFGSKACWSGNFLSLSSTQKILARDDHEYTKAYGPIPQPPQQGE